MMCYPRVDYVMFFTVASYSNFLPLTSLLGMGPDTVFFSQFIILRAFLKSIICRRACYCFCISLV